MGTEDPCALWFAVPEAPAEAQGGEPQSWSGQGKSRDLLVAGIPTALAGSQGEPTHDPLPPQTDSTSSRISQWPCAVPPPPAAREAERGWRRRSRAGVAGTGAREAGPELGAELRDPRGCAPGPPGTETRAPLQSQVASQRPGGEEPATRSHLASPKFDSPPREESPGRGPSGHRAPPASQAGTHVSIARCLSRKSGGAAGLRTRRRPRHPPRGAPGPPRPPSSRVTRVDRRRGTRAGPWRSR